MSSAQVSPRRLLIRRFSGTQRENAPLPRKNNVVAPMMTKLSTAFNELNCWIKLNENKIASAAILPAKPSTIRTPPITPKK